MNGVATEQRFKDMTDAQWFMHYKMIEKEEREDWAAKKDLIQTLLEVGLKNLETLLERNSELTAMIVSPQYFGEYLKVKDNPEKDKTPEQMEQIFKGLIESGEIETELRIEIKNDDNSVVLEKRPRKKLGIQRSEVT